MATSETAELIRVEQNTTAGLLEGSSEERAIPWAQVVFYAVFALTVFVGNGLVMASYWKFPPLQTTGNVLVAALAACDFVFGVTVLYRLTGFFVPTLTSHFYPCMLLYFVVIYSALDSVLLLAAISVDRLLTIQYSYRYLERVTPRRVGYVSLIIALISSLVAAIPLFGVHRWKPGYPCYLPMIFSPIYIFALIACVLITLAIICGTYVILFQTAMRQRRKIEATQVSQQNEKAFSQARANLRATQTIAIVVGTFSLCWLPWVLIMVYLLATDPLNTDPVVLQAYSAVILAATFNSGMNPFIYAARNKTFRNAFKNILSCGYLGKNSVSAD